MLSLYLFPALYFSLYVVLSYLVNFLPLTFSRITFTTLHLITLVITLIWLKYSSLDTSDTIRRSRVSPAKATGSRLPAQLEGNGRPVLSKAEGIGSMRESVIATVGLHLLPLLPTIVLLYLFFTGFSAGITPPHNADAGNHFFLVRRILETGRLDYATIYEGYTAPQWYPLGLHTFMAGVVSTLGQLDLLSSLPPLIWLMAAVYPLALFFFFYSATGKYWLGLLTSTISLTFFMFPYNTFSWGGWAMLVGLPLLFFALGLLYQLLRSYSPYQLVACSLLLVALFLTHPSEVFSFLLLSLPLALVHRAQFQKLFTTAWKPLLLAAFTSLLIISPTLIKGLSLVTHNPVVPILYTHYSPAAFIKMLTDFHFTVNRNYLFTLLSISGFLWLLFQRRYRDLVAATSLLLTIFTIRVLSPVLDPLYRLTFPWLDSERLYYVLIPFLGFFASVMVEQCYDWLRQHLPPLPPISPIIPVAIIALLLAYPYTRVMANNLANLKYIQVNYAPADTQDVILLDRNRHRCPLYLNNPVADAGRFIPYLSGNQVIFDGPYQLQPDYPKRLQLLEAANDASLSAQLRSLHLEYPFSCIYSGAYFVHNLSPDLIPPKLHSNPALTLLDSENGSFIFTLASSPSPLGLPLVLSATDSAQLKLYLIGDIGELETSREGIPFRRVGQSLSLYTQLPAQTLSLTGLSAHSQEQSCSLTIDGQPFTTFTFKPLGEAITLEDLDLTADQHRLDITCTKPENVPYAFVFSEIKLE